jgi:hypothetical protein
MDVGGEAASTSEGSASEGNGDGESRVSIIAMQLRPACINCKAKLQCKWMVNATRDHFGGVVGW